jgi:hypothetical protein
MLNAAQEGVEHRVQSILATETSPLAPLLDLVPLLALARIMPHRAQPL